MYLRDVGQWEDKMGIWKALKKTTKATFKASKWTAKTTWKVADRTLDALTFKKLCGDCIYFNYKAWCCVHPDNMENPDYDAILREIEPWSRIASSAFGTEVQKITRRTQCEQPL